MLPVNLKIKAFYLSFINYKNDFEKWVPTYDKSIKKVFNWIFVDFFLIQKLSESLLINDK